jgi:hypothetical protein
MAALLVALMLASLPWDADAQRGQQPRQPAAGISGLHVVGNQIQDGNGVVLRLRGVNETSAEYACIFNYGILQHQVNPGAVSDAQSVQALLSWKINAVRIPLNEDCWLNINTAGISPAYVGANYQSAIASYVNALTSAGIAVILDLHWAAPGGTQATYQIPMADRDHAPAFWSSIANTFKNNTGVIFDLFNEPYPNDNASDVYSTPTQLTNAWQCLQNGSPLAGAIPSYCPGPYYDDNGNLHTSDYRAAGMQELLNAVRATGAQNLVMVGGISYANDVQQWAAYKPTDSLNPANIAVSTHIYPDGSACAAKTCWDTSMGTLSQSYPIITGEIGQSGCATNLLDDAVNGVMTWMENHKQHYLAWAWWTEICSGSPYYGLLTDYLGTARAGYGTGYKNDLANLVGSQPSFTASAAAQPPTVARGSNLSINATVTSATATNAVVVVYEYDPSGNFYDQQAFTGQTFTAGQTRTYPVTWPVPAGAPTGGWTIRLGVFEPTFTDLLYWNDNAAQFTIAAGATSTPTRTPTTTPTRTSTPGAPTPSPTPTPGVVSCAPRPSVSVAAVSNGDGRLRVTLTTGANPGSAPNLLQSLQFTRLDNAVVEIGPQVGVTGTFNLLPAVQSQTLYVRRSRAGAASTVEMTAQDGCGAWPTFFGGGPSAF